jgi:hypothetical protein
VSQCLCEETIQLKSIDPKDIKITNIDLKGEKVGGSSNLGGKFDPGLIKEIIVKVHFREKYLKKRGILELSAELEETLAEEEIQYQNFNMRDERYIWILCN